METPLNNQQLETTSQEMVDDTEDDNGLNLYPAIRHLLLIICILLALSIIVFLIYQNGKSIYDKGI